MVWKYVYRLGIQKFSYPILCSLGPLGLGAFFPPKPLPLGPRRILAPTWQKASCALDRLYRTSVPESRWIFCYLYSEYLARLLGRISRTEQFVTVVSTFEKIVPKISVRGAQYISVMVWWQISDKQDCKKRCFPIRKSYKILISSWLWHKMYKQGEVITWCNIAGLIKYIQVLETSYSDFQRFDFWFKISNRLRIIKG